MNVATIIKGGQLRAHKGKVTLTVGAVVALAAYLTGDMTLTDMLQQVVPAVLGAF